MKNIFNIICFFLLAFITIPFVSAQTNDAGFRGQSMNGATGLFSIPTGRIGWEGPKDFGFDIGYRAIINTDRGTAHIPALTFSLFKFIELSAAFDIQPNINYYHHLHHENQDLLFGAKVKLPTAQGTAVAIGCNMQLINLTNDRFNYNAYQPYVAISYRGTFFTMPAETTVVFGKTFYSGTPHNNSDIDFGMGFDIILFPDVFGRAVHWIIDFANFGYSENAWPNHLTARTGSAWHRGVMNTGFRLDISSIPSLNQYKFLLDFIFNDLFDAGQRSFTVGLVFGIQP
ncbi:MAG: hypothetical protein FWD14_05230 [Treponema sp.]|nr:hypothetical protein [Treponema sp.]